MYTIEIDQNNWVQFLDLNVITGINKITSNWESKTILTGSYLNYHSDASTLSK